MADLGQMAYGIGRMSADQMADEMKRREIARRAEELYGRNPDALEGIVAPRRIPGMGGGGRGHGGGGISPGALNHPAFNYDFSPGFEASGGAGAYSGGGGGGAAFGGPTAGGRSLQTAGGLLQEGVGGVVGLRMPDIHEQAQVATKVREIGDETVAGLKEISDRELAAAYGGSGAYGRGSMAPGQKPGAEFQQALAMKMVGGKGGATAKAPDLELALAKAQAADAASVMPQGDENPLVALYKARIAAAQGVPAQAATPDATPLPPRLVGTPDNLLATNKQNVPPWFQSSLEAGGATPVSPVLPETPQPPPAATTDTFAADKAAWAVAKKAKEAKSTKS